MNPLPRPADTATLRLDFSASRLWRSRGARGPLPEVPAPLASASGDPWDFCPNCGSELHNERCKRRCPRCHYFMSCSDFD